MAKRTGDIELAGEITTPDGAVAGDSGQDFIISAGAGLTTGDGGDITLTPGAAPGAGSPGAIVISQTTAPTVTTNKLYNDGGALTWNGTDISASGDVTKVGTPVNNQIGIWTGDGTLEGDNDLTWTGVALNIVGALDVSTTMTFGTSNHQFGQESISSIYFRAGGSNTDADIVLKGLDEGVHGSLASTDSGGARIGFKDAGGSWTYQANNDGNHVWSTDGDTTRMTLSNAGLLSPSGSMLFIERADHIATPAATFGELWLRSDTPNSLIFTDDAGNDYDLTATGIVTEDALRNIIGGTSAGAALDGAFASDNTLLGWHAGITMPSSFGNVALGSEAMELTTSSNGVAIGQAAMQNCTTGQKNIGIGGEAFRGQVSGKLTGDDNIGIGYRVGLNSQTAFRNILIGNNVGNITSGDDNVIIGFNAAILMSQGTDNVIIGSESGANINTGVRNVILGVQAGPTAEQSDRLYIHNAESDTPFIGGDMSTGLVELSGTVRFTERADHIGTSAATFGELWVRSDTPNVLVFTDDAGTDTVLGAGGGGGVFSETGTNNIYTDAYTGSGDHNFLALDGAGDSLTTGTDNIIIGENAGTALANGGNNVILGRDALSRGVSSGNTVAIGVNAGIGLTTGQSNIAIGGSTLGTAAASVVGDDNVAIGFGAMGGAALGNANDNVAIGANTLIGLTTGDQNVSVGYNSGIKITTGGGNVAVGYNAGPTADQSNRLYINNAESDTPMIGGNFATGGVELSGTIRFTERATDIQTPTATFGELWLRSDAPNKLIFTDDAGTDFDLTASASVWTLDGTDNIYSNNAGANLSTGADNFLAGELAGDALTTQDDCIFIGDNTGLLVTVGQNVAIGSLAFNKATSASNSVIIGDQAGRGITTGDRTIVIGQGAVGNAGGTLTSPDNIFIGSGVANSASLAAATRNTVVGSSAMQALTTGDDNVAIGFDAGDAITTGSDNTAVGLSSLSQVIGGAQNSGFGKNSGFSITTGTFNTGIGYGAMSGAAAITGSNNIALGANAFADNPATVSGDDNIGIGEFAGRAITSASNSIAIGFSALGHTTPSLTGDSNIAIGNGAMNSAGLTTAANNVVIGTSAGIALTDGLDNILIGQNAGAALTGQNNNVFIGDDAGLVTAQALNTGIGQEALRRATGSTQSTAIGYQAGAAVTTGNQNTALGDHALGNVSASVTGGFNTAVGSTAMNSAAMAAASNNIALGYFNMQGLTSGTYNIVIGDQAADNITTGTENIIIGRDAGPTANQSNRLYINNAESNTPLIFGDFSTSEVIVNGTLEVTDGFTMPLASQSETGTSYTAVLADADKMITLDNAAAITVTIPANASVAYPVGTKLNFLQLGAGQVTVAITTDTLNVESSLTLLLAGQYAAATAFKVTATTWVLFGNLEAA